MVDVLKGSGVLGGGEGGWPAAVASAAAAVDSTALARLKLDQLGILMAHRTPHSSNCITDRLKDATAKASALAAG